MREVIKLGIVLLAGLSASVASACPCGCGSIATGALEPGQKAKIITSASYDSNIVTVTPSGDRLNDYVFDRSLKSDLTMTRALTTKTTLTASIFGYRNFKDEHSSKFLAGDPSVSLGHTLLMQDFTRPLWPQVIGHVSYKHPLAKSYREASQDATEESFLEVGGNGLQEVAVGVDATWTIMTTWFAGTGVRFTGFPEVFAEKEVGPDKALSVRAQVGHTWMGRGSLSLENSLEWLDDIVEDGNRAPGSARRLDRMSVAGSLVLTPFHSLGLSLSRQSVFGVARNSVGSDTVKLSYQAVFM